jgi:hypothetical protein
MNSFPITSRQHYLTGQAALNVPSADGHFADWHFSEVFLSGRGKLPIAGQDLPDTSHLFGSYGVHDCTAVLRRYGLALGTQQKVFAANHVRAALDLVVAGISKGKVPSHITLDDTIDDDADRVAFYEQMSVLKQRISDNKALLLLEQWESQQHQ